MSKAFSILCLLLSVFASDALCQTGTDMDAFTQKVQHLIQQNEANPAIWSVSVWDSKGNEIFTYQPDVLLRPASNMKMVSSAAIIDFFGAEHSISTPLFGLGEQVGTTWKGNLIIQGKGDPSIDRHFFEEDPLLVFRNWAKKIKERGISRIEGSIIGNDSYFDQEPYPKSWEWYDLSFYYAPVISALSFNGNCVELEVHAEGPVGSTPQISWFPFKTNYISFTNLQKIVDKDESYEEYYRRLPGSNNITLGSKVPQAYEEEENLTIDEPTLFTADVIKRVLLEEGIEVAGPIAMEHQSRDFGSQKYVKFAEHNSPPMAEMLTHLNKESDNFYTEMFLKLLGKHAFDEVGSTENGVKAVRNFLATADVDTNLVLQYDASGLSNQNLISTASMIKILQHMNQHQYGTQWKDGLAIAGVDGTLDYRFKSHPAFNKIKAKTGYISGARALSGYLETASGNELIFSMITNNFVSRVRKVDEVHEQILAWLFESF